MRRMKTSTKNEKQQNQATDTLNVQLVVNDVARYGELMSLGTIKRTQIFMQIARYFVGFNQFWIFSVDFHNFPVSSFMVINPMRATLIHADTQTDRRT